MVQDPMEYDSPLDCEHLEVQCYSQLSLEPFKSRF